MNNECKLDPRLRRYFYDQMEIAQVTKKSGSEVFINVSDVESLKWVGDKDSGITEFVNIIDGYCTAKIVPEKLKSVCDKLTKQAGVIEIEGVRFFKPHLDKSVNRIYGWAGKGPKDPLNQGAGVVIGIVDYGIDFTLEDFQDPGTGKTRIAYLWDQALEAQGNTEKTPEKYKYGVEYSRVQIDAALDGWRKTKDRFAVVRHDSRNREFPDIDGHGTHVAGIAAGNGQTGDCEFPKANYVGVAPGSTLVFVNLGRPDMLDQVNSPSGTLANSVNLAHAVAYCFEKADKLAMPCVVNLSMGFNGGGHDGNMAVERIIDALLKKSGRAVVVSAGNEGAKLVHSGGSLLRNQCIEIGWMVGAVVGGIAHDDPTTNELEVWYSSGSRINVRLVAPGDREKSCEVIPGEGCIFRYKGGEEASITSDIETPGHGDARIHIQLSKGTRKKGIRARKWLVELTATDVAATELADGVRFDAWIERDISTHLSYHKESRFAPDSASTEITLTTPSTAGSVITVAAFSNVDAVSGVASRSPDSKTMSDASGRGPTRDRRKKPELAAPGYSVLSSNACAGEKENGVARTARVSKGGTSMSAPHVTGVVARLLGRKRNLSAEQIRHILVESAAQPVSSVKWDPKWGYGMVDAERAMQKLEELYGLKV